MMMLLAVHLLAAPLYSDALWANCKVPPISMVTPL